MQKRNLLTRGARTMECWYNSAEALCFITWLLRIPLSNSIVSLGFSMAAFRKNSFRLFLELRHMAIFIVIGDGLSFISIYMWYTWDLQAFVFWCSIGVTDLGKFDLSWTKWALCRSSYKKSFDPQGRKKPP